MDANKMPEMPEADLKAGADWPKDYFESKNVHRLHAEWLAFSASAEQRGYLAGLEAAKACVPEVADEDAYQYDRAEQYGHNNCRNLTLANLTALEQEAKK